MDCFDETLQAAQEGQDWAVGGLYAAHHPPLLAYLSWAEPSAAEDLAAETWLAVAERIGVFQGDERGFRAWLFAIARRRIADHRRRGVRHRTKPVLQEFFTGLAGIDDPEQAVVERLASEDLLAQLDQVLSKDQAEIVVLRVVAGFSVEETARVVSKRHGAVRALQHRALLRLARTASSMSSIEA
ncbi:MAG: sigma-70 family RNA polymerase sigma factor [Acidimicrobiaceae bacterium]|nr:sigma-70 family RNA polymerase sigma factor [Acidimicrobiaceae bacterium]